MSWLEIVGIIFLSLMAIPIVCLIFYGIYNLIAFVGRMVFVVSYIAVCSFLYDQTTYEEQKIQEDTIDYLSKSQKERYFELKKEIAELKEKIRREKNDL